MPYAFDPELLPLVEMLPASDFANIEASRANLESLLGPMNPLRDEGIIYALRMMEAGVSVELHSYPGTFHGSAIMPNAAVSRRASEELMVALRRGLGL